MGPSTFFRRLHRIPIRRIISRTVLISAVISVFLGLSLGTSTALGVDSRTYVSTEDGVNRFPLSVDGESVPLYVSGDDHQGVIRVLKDLRTDIGRVTGAEPMMSVDTLPESDRLVIAGTIGKSQVIDSLIRENKIDVSDIRDKWETTLIQVVDQPLPDVQQALVIAGSDKRGTIYGIYDLCEEIGVSPWHFWADVPVKEKSSLYILPGRHTQGPPAVKYRGIFINDEAPALTGWVYDTYDGFNHHFYETVFELILRMKGNYLWPAMWGKTFFVEDTLNPELADKYGIVIGTSHHEPMMRANVEWDMYGTGAWNYVKNDSVLREYWREGIRRMEDRESIITVGMRGQGDYAMSDSTNITLLKDIVRDQREIIEDVTGEDASEVPQVWALYKEVQEYYDQGMQVPEDITLMFADDNWGNIRRLPKPGDTLRSGGYGIYYHFDYVGGPRSYRWINTNLIPRIWEQMHLAYEHMARRIWIVNVGDIKPMELPTTFFLDYAWDPERWTADRLPEYTRLWAEQQFPGEYAGEIADILSKYTKYNARRKPELLSPDTYSLTDFREAERIVKKYNALEETAVRIGKQLPKQYQAAYYQLVLYPVKACANLNELYVTVAKNRKYAEQARAMTNELADSAVALFGKDARLAQYYNTEMADGKWNHMMDQTYIGYTNWNNPERDRMPWVTRIQVPEAAEIGVAIQGSDNWWPRTRETKPVLPQFDVYQQQRYYIEIFNRGRTPFDYTVDPGEPWLQVSSREGTVDDQVRVWVSVDWSQVPSGTHIAPIIVNGPGDWKVEVEAVAANPESPNRDQVQGFVEGNGYVSMESVHYTDAVNTSDIFWQEIPNLGRTLSAMTPFPVTADSQVVSDETPHLEYRVYLADTGTVEVRAHLSPTLNFHDTQGLHYGVSFDDNPPQLVNMHADKSHRAWQEWVRNNINIQTSRHTIDEPGEHVLKFWMVDPGVVLQKLVIDAGGMGSSYLGPPESYYRYD